jgi:hypothetical protein
MRRFRITLATLMAIVPFFAFAFAALKYADDLWASAAFTLAAVVLSLAVVGTLVRRGSGRAFWIGFAVPGWVYLALSFGPWFPSMAISPPPLLPTRLLAYVYPYLARPERPDRTFEPSKVVDPILAEQPSSPPGGMVLISEVDHQPTGPVVYGWSTYWYSRVGHSLSALFLGLLGAMAGLLMAGRDDRAGVPPAPATRP